MNLEIYLTAAKQTAKNAGDYLIKHFHDAHQISSKSHINDLVTECDKFSENLIKKELSSQFPDHSFLCEESGMDLHENRFLWVVDPLDGTVNFAKKIPFFCVSIALVIDNRLSVGVIYCPTTQELFYATYQGGAFCNDKKILVSDQKDLKSAFGATGFPYRIQDNVEKTIKPIVKLLGMGVPLRRLGSAALDLAYTACGRFDLFFEAYLEAWDYSAGALLIQEAGGLISDFQNKSLTYKKNSSILASNRSLHEAMMSKVLI
jgi:myo-inositol-1(or 4)-monophosphatase